MSQQTTNSTSSQAGAEGAAETGSAAGIVKWYSLAKGYGFIESEHDGAAQDIFVHYTDVTGETLVEGESVRFEVVDSPKGLKARNVIRADEAAC